MLDNNSLGALQDLLDVRPVEGTASSSVASTTFRGDSAGLEGMALFGGHLLGQAVASACKAVEQQEQQEVAQQAGQEPGKQSRLHSLHSYFLLPGDGLLPVNYEVSEIRSGRSFCSRRVLARQGEGADAKQIFDMTASFHKPEQGRYEPMSVPAPTGLADPTSLPTFQDCIDELGPIFGEHWSHYPRPVEYRVARAPWLPVGASPQQGIDFWFRVQHQLPDDPTTHTALLAYMSDDCLSDNVGVPYGITAGTEDIMMVSLDHSMWFHQPVRADEWVFVQQWPLVAYGARGTAQAYFWQDGRLVATAVQEALTRF